MPTIICNECRKLFYLGKKDYNSTIGDFENFCSVKCLINYISSYNEERSGETYWHYRPMFVGDMFYD